MSRFVDRTDQFLSRDDARAVSQAQAITWIGEIPCFAIRMMLTVAETPFLRDLFSAELARRAALEADEPSPLEGFEAAVIRRINTPDPARDAEYERARLDRDGTARPRTRIVKHANAMHCISGSARAGDDLELREERKGTAIKLR